MVKGNSMTEDQKTLALMVSVIVAGKSTTTQGTVTGVWRAEILKALKTAELILEVVEWKYPETSYSPPPIPPPP